jgi:hypothetical protein
MTISLHYGGGKHTMKTCTKWCKQRGSRTEDANNKTKMPRLQLKKKGGGL